MKGQVRNKRKTHLWYKLVRYGTQAIYLLMIAFSIMGRNFILTVGLMAISFIGGAWFCGWLCPFGSAQEWLGKLGRKLSFKKLRVPHKVERFLMFSRYVLFAASFTGLAAFAFLSGPYQSFMGVVTRNVAYLTVPAWSFLGLILISSLFIDRPFCRYLCIEGARHGALSLGRVFSVKRNETSCINCGACDRACPAQVKVSTKSHIRHPQCINCLECMAACPVEDALSYGYTLKPKKKRNIAYEAST